MSGDADAYAVRALALALGAASPRAPEKWSHQPAGVGEKTGLDCWDVLPVCSAVGVLLLQDHSHLLYQLFEFRVC